MTKASQGDPKVRSHKATFILEVLTFRKYKTTCVSLLSYSWPQNVALPASIDQFFVAIVRDAIRTPCAGSLAAVYDLMSGACQRLPQLLHPADSDGNSKL